jgi:hypothetical protein
MRKNNSQKNNNTNSNNINNNINVNVNVNGDDENNKKINDDKLHYKFERKKSSEKKENLIKNENIINKHENNVIYESKYLSPNKKNVNVYNYDEKPIKPSHKNFLELLEQSLRKKKFGIF